MSDLWLFEDFVDRENLHELYTDKIQSCGKYGYTNDANPDHHGRHCFALPSVHLKFEVKSVTSNTHDPRSDQNDGKPGRCIWGAVRW